MARRKKHYKDCFVNGHCGYDCPNNAVFYIDDKYGFGIAEDIGFREIKCSECYYESGECKDCLFSNTEHCPNRNSPKNSLDE